MFSSKVARKAQVVEKRHYWISETAHFKKFTRKHFFIFKASGDCGENFLKIGDDFGAGR
jgi:hypothetical protein